MAPAAAAAAAAAASSSTAVILPALHHALCRLSITNPRLIPSPPTQPRRASVAIILRVRPNPQDDEYLGRQYDADGLPLPGSDVDRILTQSGLGLGGSATAPAAEASSSSSSSNNGNGGVGGGNGQVNLDTVVSQVGASAGSTSRTPPANTPAVQQINSSLASFFSLPWVKRGVPEILYIKRATRPTDKWSAHVAFPGGRRDETDEDALYTAMRETWEEVGLDLADRDFLHVGQLDDREITSSLGKRLLMVLSPFVFIQTTPFSHHPELQPTEVASAHWVPLSHLYTPRPKWGVVSIDISTRLAPKSPGVRLALQSLLGKMDFRCILLPNEPWAIAGEEDEEDESSSSSNASFVSGGVSEEEEAHRRRKEQRRAERLAAALKSAGLEDDARSELKLWGLTLGMTIDLLAHMSTLPTAAAVPAPGVDTSTGSASQQQQASHPATSTSPAAQPSLTSILSSAPPSRLPLALRSIATRVKDELHLNPPQMTHAKSPSLTSVFPRFSNPDVNFWIWIFGYRYRTVVRSWERSLGTPMERRFNWSGLALGAFYSAVRRALIVALLLRGLGALGFVGLSGWLVGRRWGRWRRGEPGWGLVAALPH